MSCGDITLDGISCPSPLTAKLPYLPVGRLINYNIDSVIIRETPALEMNVRIEKLAPREMK